MKLYLLELRCELSMQWDVYDSAVVAAKSNTEAQKIHPEYNERYPEDRCWGSEAWAETPEMVKATCIGTASRGTKAGIICSSFNAG